MLSENPITVIPPGYETGLASMIDESKPTINGTKYLIPMGGILPQLINEPNILGVKWSKIVKLCLDKKKSG